MATVESSVADPAIVAIPKVPKLVAGDRLSRAEFERRYAAMPAVKKAELIEGVVYTPSPVSYDHASPHFDLIGLLCLYRIATPGIAGCDNATLRLDLENEPQPDAFLRVLSECGGRTRVEEGYVAGAPELVAEIAVSSKSYDLHDKLRAYQRNGVLEYLVWRVGDAAIDWFALRDDRFERLPPSDAGVFKSVNFPGLWLDPAALLRGDLAQALAVLQQGIASPEHTDFVARLQAESAKAR